MGSTAKTVRVQPQLRTGRRKQSWVRRPRPWASRGLGGRGPSKVLAGARQPLEAMDRQVRTLAVTTEVPLEGPASWQLCRPRRHQWFLAASLATHTRHLELPIRRPLGPVQPLPLSPASTRCPSGYMALGKCPTSLGLRILHGKMGTTACCEDSTQQPRPHRGAVPVVTDRKGWGWSGCAEWSGWPAAAGRGRRAVEGARPLRSPAAWWGARVKREPEAGAGGATRVGRAGAPRPQGSPRMPGPQGPPEHPAPPLRTERDTYWNLSCTSPGCPVSWRPAGPECRRVRARPAPSSLSSTGPREPPGGTRKVSVRGCP